MWEQRGKAPVLKEMRDRWRCCGVFLSVAPFSFPDGRSGGEVVLAARRATTSGGARPVAVATVAAEESGEEDAAERGASVLIGPDGWRRRGCLGKMSPAGGRRKPNSGQGAAGSIVSVKWEWGGWFSKNKIKTGWGAAVWRRDRFKVFCGFSPFTKLPPLLCELKTSIYR